MSENAQFRVEDEDWLQVDPIITGVILDMSSNVSSGFKNILERLARLLEYNEVPADRRSLVRLRKPRSAEELLDQMFPEAYTDAALAAQFRRRHGAHIRAEVLAATHRVLGGWSDPPPTSLAWSEVDDWLMAFGVAQLMFVKRKRYPISSRSGREAEMNQRWLRFLQENLLLAMRPTLVEVIRSQSRTGRSQHTL